MKCAACGTELSNFGCEMPDCNDDHTRERCLEAQLAEARRERDRLQAGWQQALEAERDEANRRVEAESQLRATAAKLAKALEMVAEAIDLSEEGWSYASDYFKQKWLGDKHDELRQRLAALSLDPPEAAEKRENGK